MLRVQTYQGDELYRILKNVLDMYNDAFPKLNFKKIAEKNNIPNTEWALMLLSFRLWCLCKSILSCIDFYSVAVLYRAFIEHFFKHIYIFLSCLNNGDEIATEYVSVNHFSGEALKKLRKKMWPNNLFSSGKFRDTKKFREFRKKADETTIKFRFDEVVKSISELLSNESPSEIAQLQKMFREEMVKYSLLSSYVHAGPIAVLDLGTKPIKKDIEMISKLQTILAYQSNIFLLTQYPSEHQDELKKLLEKIHTNSEKASIIYEEYCEKMKGSNCQQK